MSVPSELYRPSLALLTDLYQLTMAYGYWKAGIGDRHAVFHLFFRRNPFQGGFSIACGLADIIGLLDDFHFDDSDLAYLAELRGNDEKPLFDRGFLDMLRSLRFSCDVDAVPEGTVVFPHEPTTATTVRVRDGQVLLTDGPYVEGAEIATGFYLLAATDRDEAVKLAAMIPASAVQLRQLAGVSGL